MPPFTLFTIVNSFKLDVTNTKAVIVVLVLNVFFRLFTRVEYFLAASHIVYGLNLI